MVPIIDGSAILNKAFVQSVGDSVHTTLHKDLRSTIMSFQVNNLTLANKEWKVGRWGGGRREGVLIPLNYNLTDKPWALPSMPQSGSRTWGAGDVNLQASLVAHLEREHGHFLRHFNVVPDTEVASVLSYHHIAQWDPLHIGAVVEEWGMRLRLNVVEVELDGHRESGEITIRQTLKLKQV